MNNLWTFFGLSIIFYLLASINGEPFNGTGWFTEVSDPMDEQQFQNLKLENENLKLRLELVELNMMKQQNNYRKAESKLKRIEDYLTKLDQQLTSFIIKHESLDISANAINAKTDFPVGTEQNTVENAEKKVMSTADKEELIIKSVDMNTTLNMLQGIQSTLSKIENKYSTDEQAMLTVIGKENPVTCIRNSDNKLVCSDVDLPTSCTKCSKNICRIQNHLLSPKSFIVPCNDTTDGGGWTVIQRRVNDSVDFYRDWSEYKQGFGDLDGNYWIGLDKLHALTKTLAPVELRIELMDFDNVVKYAKYDSFMIGDESTKYSLQNVGVYAGTAGDSFSNHKGHMFSTRDQDNDLSKKGCAQNKRGAWWYLNCYYSNLNSQYYNQSHVTYHGSGIVWEKFHGFDYSLKFVQMMIRPKKL